MSLINSPYLQKCFYIICCAFNKANKSAGRPRKRWVPEVEKKKKKSVNTIND